MALKTIHVSDIPNLDHHLQENAELSLCSTRFSNLCEDDDGVEYYKFSKFMVMGHRGSGTNMLQSCDKRMKSIKENSILSFTTAAKLDLDFVEFDVQVTKDDCPVIFHDNFILTEHQGTIVEQRVTDLTLPEFLTFGPQKEFENVGKPLFRKTRDGSTFEWKVEEDDPLCTLQEAFQKVDGTIGFNIELKFDDHLIYKRDEIEHVLQAILKVVYESAKERPIIFSSFLPDAAQIMRKMQKKYPVFFLTNGGSEIYMDIRRNSLDEAIKVCTEGGLQGIVSEVKAILRNPEAVTRMKESKLSLISYGLLNNMPEVVYVQHLMGIQGVIVDFGREITEAVSVFNNPSNSREEIARMGNCNVKDWYQQNYQQSISLVQ